MLWLSIKITHVAQLAFLQRDWSNNAAQNESVLLQAQTDAYASGSSALLLMSVSSLDDKHPQSTSEKCDAAVRCLTCRSVFSHLESNLA